MVDHDVAQDSGRRRAAWTCVSRSDRLVQLGLHGQTGRAGPACGADKKSKATFLPRAATASPLPPAGEHMPVPRPWHEETPETPCYPILSRLSRLRISAPRLAASCLGKQPLCAGKVPHPEDQSQRLCPQPRYCGASGVALSLGACPNPLPPAPNSTTMLPE
jgi:hypothetical protein